MFSLFFAARYFIICFYFFEDVFVVARSLWRLVWHKTHAFLKKTSSKIPSGGDGPKL